MSDTSSSRDLPVVVSKEIIESAYPKLSASLPPQAPPPLPLPSPRQLKKAEPELLKPLTTGSEHDLNVTPTALDLSANTASCSVLPSALTYKPQIQSQLFELHEDPTVAAICGQDELATRPVFDKPSISNKKRSRSGTASKPPASVATKMTLLISSGPDTRKHFKLDATGAIKVVRDSHPFTYSFVQEELAGIEELAALIEKYSQNPRAIVIRGTPTLGLGDRVQRLLTNFPEPPEGIPWVMLDFDNVKVPAGMSPTSRDAIEYLITHLPAPFRHASYVFQFSASAGIRNADGTPYKAGINVHLFFWLSRAVPGKALSAFLVLHCIASGFYETTFKSDIARIVYGIDPAVIRSSNQPHFLATPAIEASIQCELTHDQRQGLVRKLTDVVDLPELPSNVIAQAAEKGREVLSAWQRKCGLVPKTVFAKSRNASVTATTYLSNPKRPANQVGRKLAKVEGPKELKHSNGQTLQLIKLFFDGESSPGSWYVTDNTPTLARHHGGTIMPLMELSVDAHNFVRDDCKWFQEVVSRDLSLTAEGYLPAFSTFMTAKYSLVLAPTGSGKTTAFCNFAAARRNRSTIIYAAQTIALTRQMEEDLQAANIHVTHYSDFDRCAELGCGVYVTTNKSLPKIIGAAKQQGKHFILVIDEVHVALDDFMRSDATNKVLEDSMLRAEQTIFMTGTLTMLQRQKLADTVAQTPGGLSIENFTVYEFAAVKSHPLRLVPQQTLGADLVALFRSYQSMKERSEPLPRTVVIASTSAMKKFELLLERFDLTDDAMVVSRQEATPSEIEAARVGTHPILISSPLFAIGLNFECPPAVLWVTFEYLNDLDTSQIVQTVNRGNRTAGACEVRLYAGSMDETPSRNVQEDVERQRLEEYFITESEIAGVIDPHYQLDRATYNELRKQQEKDTAKSLAKLCLNNAIQNYAIVEEWVDDLPRESNDADLFKSIKSEARNAYKADVGQHVPDEGSMTNSSLTFMLRLLRESRRDAVLNDQAPKETTDRELAVLACLTGNPKHLGKSAAPDGATILRLHAEIPPYLGSQYDAEKSAQGNKVKALKVQDMIEIVNLLEKLKLGTIDGTEFGRKMRQKLPRRGVLALANGESDYLSWSKKLEAMDGDLGRYSTAAPGMRLLIDSRFFKAAQDFLARCGVTFEKSKSKSGRHCLDPSKPVVPDWDFGRVRLQLEMFAASLGARPLDLEAPYIEAQKCKGGQVSMKVCAECTHWDLDSLCMLGRTNQAGWDFSLELPAENTCEGFTPQPARIRKLKALWLHPENLRISGSEEPMKSHGTLELEGVAKVL